MIAGLLLAFSLLAGDKSDCKCGSGCECKDGRVASCCSCAKGECRCADVAAPSMSTAEYAADVALHLGLAHLKNTPLAGSERLVLLSDAHRFGLDFYSARAMWNLVRDHAGLMRDTIRVNDPANFHEWERECAWRYRVYYLADDVLNCPQMSVGAKLNSLDELRRLIGDEAYNAGRLPAPTPNYKVAGR